MSFTFTTLKTAVQDYTQNSETTFVNTLPTFIKNAEERMLELELADQDDVGIQADITDITATITSLKAKLTELEG